MKSLFDVIMYRMSFIIIIFISKNGKMTVISTIFV